MPPWNLPPLPEQGAYLDFGSCCQEDIVWGLHGFTFLLLGPLPYQEVEMSGQVSPQQRLVGWDVQQLGHGFYIETGLQNLGTQPQRIQLKSVLSDEIFQACLGHSLRLFWDYFFVFYRKYTTKNKERELTS